MKGLFGSATAALSFAAFGLAMGCVGAPAFGDAGAAVFTAPTALQVCPGFSRRNLGTVSARGRLDAYAPSVPTPAGPLLTAPTDPVCVSSGMGWRPSSGRRHDGVDFAPTSARRGVYAAGPGRVAYAGWNGGYGRMVEIDHGAGVSTFYAHFSAFAPGLSVGDRVETGDPLGKMGSSGNSTGVHLHYEIRIDGRSIDPLDPPPAPEVLVAEAPPLLLARVPRPTSSDRVRATFASIDAARAEADAAWSARVSLAGGFAAPVAAPPPPPPRTRFARVDEPAPVATLPTARSGAERLNPAWGANIAAHRGDAEARPQASTTERTRRAPSEPIPFPTRAPPTP